MPSHFQKRGAIERELLKSRAFRSLLLGSSADDFAQSAVPIALAFTVLQSGYGVGELALVVGTRSVVSLLFTLAGGWAGDRFSRPLILIGANASAGFTLLVLGALIGLGNDSIVIIVLLSSVSGALGAVAAPAAGSTLPLIVERANLGSANSILRVSISAAAVGGAALAGGTSAIFPAWVGLVVAGALYLTASTCYLPLARALRNSVVEYGPAMKPIRDGWRILWTTPWVWVTVAAFSLINAVYQGGFLILGPVAADSTYGSAGWGLVIAMQMVGFIVGGFLSLRFNRRRRLSIGYACSLTMALPLVGLALSVPLPVQILLTLIAGVGAEQLSVAWATVVQAKVSEKNLSSVVAFDLLGSSLLQPVGQFAAAPLALAFGAAPILLLGALVIVGTLSVAGVSPAVRRIESNAPIST